MSINKQQIESVSSLSKDERYLYFLSHVVDWEEVWYIESDFAYYDLMGKEEILYLFSHKEYAEIYSTSLEESYRLKSMDLETLLTKLEEKKELRIGVFPTLLDKAFIVRKEIFLEDIEEECQKY